MASVVAFSAPQPAPSYRKIRCVSRGFETLFTALFIALVALAAASLWILLFYQGTLIAVGPRGGLITTGPLPPDFIPFRAWPLTEKLAYTPVVFVRAMPIILLFWLLRALFGAYARGDVFTPDNARRIQAMGACLVADAAAPFVCHVVLSATGYEIDRMWAHMVSLQELVLGAIVFLIALVMQAGHEIEQDRQGFV
jgi:hypothetical protein